MCRKISFFPFISSIVYVQIFTKVFEGSSAHQKNPTQNQMTY